MQNKILIMFSIINWLKIDLFLNLSCIVYRQFILKKNFLQDEDSGILVTITLKSKDVNSCSLIFLDAKTMTEVAKATLNLPAPVPMPIHGDFFENDL